MWDNDGDATLPLSAFTEVYQGPDRKFKHAKLKPGQTYRFRVAAINAAGRGALGEVWGYKRRGALGEVWGYKGRGALGEVWGYKRRGALGEVKGYKGRGAL